MRTSRPPKSKVNRSRLAAAEHAYDLGVREAEYRGADPETDLVVKRLRGEMLAARLPENSDRESAYWAELRARGARSMRRNFRPKKGQKAQVSIGHGEWVTGTVVKVHKGKYKGEYEVEVPSMTGSTIYGTHPTHMRPAHGLRTSRRRMTRHTARRRTSLRRNARKSGRLRDMPTPSVLGYELDRATLTPLRHAIDTRAPGDYGSDPIGDGTFRMVPSGDIVDFAERNRRLALRRNASWDERSVAAANLRNAYARGDLAGARRAQTALTHIDLALMPKAAMKRNTSRRANVHTPETNQEGLTWDEWSRAAWPFAGDYYEARQAWKQGEDPTEHRSGRHSRSKSLHRNARRRSAVSPAEATAHAMGQQAFLDGKGMAPALNAAFNKFLLSEKRPHKELMAVMTAYTSGWTEANLDAPVSGWTDAENAAWQARRHPRRTSLRHNTNRRTSRRRSHR